MGSNICTSRLVVLLLVAAVTGQTNASGAFTTVQSYLNTIPTLSKFVTIIRGTELEVIFNNPTAAVTVFAPTDAAWDAVAAGVTGVNSTGRVTLLQYHVSSEQLDAVSLTDKQTVTTLAGIPLQVDLRLRAGSVLLLGQQSMATVVSSRVTGQSIVYIINAVLLPFPLVPASSTQQGTATIALSVFSKALKHLPVFLRLGGAGASKSQTSSGAKLEMLASQGHPSPASRNFSNKGAPGADIIPPSPYTPDKTKCNVPGQVYQVFGVNSSGVLIKPFTRPFKNPTFATPQNRVCRSDSHCMTVYSLDVEEKEVDLGCPTPTVMLTYNGTVPGPTFVTPVGEEVLVRVNNKLAGGVLSKEGEGQCNKGGERPVGLPLSLHNHGQATLAAWDGWADNQMCPGETKDYLYANNRPNTGWYHDHSLGLTAKQVYKGLAGFYIPSIKRGNNNNCGEPWSLDKVPDYLVMLGDKRLNAHCQLDLDLQGVDSDNFYGDVQLVSGKPWPVLTVHPTSVRLRLLNAALSRPYKVFLADSTGKNVGAQPSLAGGKSKCQVVAADGGFLPEPVNMPADGIFMGVAERYEIVCDLRDHGGQTLYLWNADDSKRTSGNVPFFCYSHLLMQVKVLDTCGGSCSMPPGPLPLSPSGQDVLCGGGCYTTVKGDKNPCSALPANDKQMACCPTGQYCMRQNATHYVCRASQQPAPTCWLPSEPEPTAFGLRCGGRCFRDADCKSWPEAKACCPAGQFCWFADENNWYCRDNPVPGSAATQPPPDKTCSLPQPTYPTAKRPTIMDPLLTQADYNAAMLLSSKGQAHRYLTFDKSGGSWTINGQTWNDFKVAVNNIGQGTWEVWRITVNGGWYHPVHIHLVDFWVISRSRPVEKVLPYEERAPKDVISLAPGEQANLLIRWGPHRGDYMFHCHNLVHEDRLMLRAFEVVKPDTSFNAASAQAGSAATDYTRISAATDIVYDDYNAKAPMSVLPTATPPALGAAYLQGLVDANYYRIFYPMGMDDAVLNDKVTNPWKVEVYRGIDMCPVDALQPEGMSGQVGGDTVTNAVANAG